MLSLLRRVNGAAHVLIPLMDYAEIDKGIKRLTAELELIDTFERLYAEDEGSDYHVQIGRRARRLRRTEITTELRYLRELCARLKTSSCSDFVTSCRRAKQ
jgi:hypothetical protein